MKEGDRVIHWHGTSGEITKRWYWKHSGFEFYAMQPDDPELETIYGNLEDFKVEVIPVTEEEDASVPQ